MMNMKAFILNSFIFTAGAAIGSAVTYKLLKTKFEQIANEEIRSVKEMYRQKAEDDAEDELVGDLEPKRVSEVPESLAAEYAKIINNAGYADEVEEEDDMTYVIPPEEFGELDGYSTVTLYCHTDGVIVDQYGDMVENANKLVGDDVMSHFGEYEDDSVFVRNDARKCDYEVLKELSAYYDESVED